LGFPILNSLLSGSLSISTLLIETGVGGYAWQVLPSYERAKVHIDNEIQRFSRNIYLDSEDIGGHLSRLLTNALNASAKLAKYRLKMTSPVYILAVVLVPWFKWAYFNAKMSKGELLEAKKSALNHWNTYYANLPLPEEPQSAGPMSATATSTNQTFAQVSLVPLLLILYI
jgi:hypothetical protein